MQFTTAQTAAASKQQDSKTSLRKEFAGAEACATCHQNIAQTYERTAHNRTTTAASRASVLGSFEAGKNELPTLDPTLHFRMDAKAGGMSVTAVFGDSPNAKERSERIYIVVGAGRGGQTYAYWRGDRLFELPVS
jgi:hypothetical protein